MEKKYEINITLSKDGQSRIYLIERPFANCSFPNGLKRAVKRNYEKIYRNCERNLGSGLCVAEFRHKGKLLGTLNINVL